MSNPISPTIGRKVYWREGAGQPVNDATIIDVHDKSTVTVKVTMRNGERKVWHNVPIVQDNGHAPASGGFCHWMPFQLGQVQASGVALAPPAPASHGAEAGNPTTGGMTPKS